MEWTKIKPKHYLYNDLTLMDKGVMVTIVCLAAHLERMPTEVEMIKATHYKSLTALQHKLNDCLIEGQEGVNDRSMSVQYIVNKVLEDAQDIDHKRKGGRDRQKRYVEKKKQDDASDDAADKRREDKIREDKIRESRTKAKPLSIFEVGEYFKKIGFLEDPQRWWDFYASNGWKVGRNPMKDWKACVRRWKQTHQDKNKPTLTKAQARTVASAKGLAKQWRDDERHEKTDVSEGSGDSIFSVPKQGDGYVPGLGYAKGS